MENNSSGLEPSPVLQEIPLAAIRPLPHNPRQVIKPGTIEACAASLKAIGQETPLKVRPLTPEERQKDPEHEFELVGGHIRLSAARLLGWKTIRAVVQSLSPEEVELAAVMDNQGEEMHWLDWYQVVERLMEREGATQQKVGDWLGMKQPAVSSALRTIKVLNKAAREAVYKNFINPDGYEMAESCAFRLADLGNPDQVEKALKVVLERKLRESQVKGLVKWMKEGKDPRGFMAPKKEAYRNQKAIEGRFDPNDPKAKIWAPIPTTVQVREAGENYKVTLTLSRGDAPVAVYGALSALEQVRVLQGLTPDTTFQQALPGLIREAANVRDSWKKGIPSSKAPAVPKAGKGKGSPLPSNDHGVGGSKKPEDYLAEALKNLKELESSVPGMKGLFDDVLKPKAKKWKK